MGVRAEELGSTTARVVSTSRDGDILHRENSETLALRACGSSHGSYGGFGQKLELPLPSELSYTTELKGAGAGCCGCPGSR